LIQRQQTKDNGDDVSELGDGDYDDNTLDDISGTDWSGDTENKGVTGTEWRDPRPPDETRADVHTAMYRKDDAAIQREIAISATVREIPWYVDYFTPILKQDSVGWGRADEAGVSAAPAAEAQWLAVSRAEPKTISVTAAIALCRDPGSAARKTVRTHLYALEGLSKLAHHTTPISHTNLTSATLRYDPARGAPLLTDFSLAVAAGPDADPGALRLAGAPPEWRAKCVDMRLMWEIQGMGDSDHPVTSAEAFALRDVAVQHLDTEMREAGVAAPAADEAKAELTQQIEGWVDGDWADVRAALAEGFDGWDVYSLARLYLDVLDDTFESISETGPETEESGEDIATTDDWLAMYKEALRECVAAPMGAARDSPSAAWERVNDAAGSARGKRIALRAP
jgi:hypothetical protein